MKLIVMFAFLLCVVSVSVGRAQQTVSQTTAQQANSQQAQVPPGTILYDDFNHKWLDPGKWQSTNPQCWFTLECVREIQNGHLRLAVRDFGRTDSDSGVQWSESEVYFLDPNAVTSIKADITVRSFSGIGCATNDTDLTHTQVSIGGNFFNIGTGDPSGDVIAWLIIWVDTLNPQTMAASLWWGYGDQGSDTLIAYYPFGTPLIGTFKWDKANHQFIAGTKVKGAPGAGTEIAVPYLVPDTAPPVSATKNLNAGAHSLNCTSGKTNAQVEATFDNVIINH